MTATNKAQALVGCQNQACAEEVSYPLDMLRWFNGRPICESCYDDLRGEDDTDPAPWDDLPEIKLSELHE